MLPTLKIFFHESMWMVTWLVLTESSIARCLLQKIYKNEPNSRDWEQVGALMSGWQAGAQPDVFYQYITKQNQMAWCKFYLLANKPSLTMLTLVRVWRFQVRLYTRNTNNVLVGRYCKVVSDQWLHGAATHHSWRHNPCAVESSPKVSGDVMLCICLENKTFNIYTFRL